MGHAVDCNGNTSCANLGDLPGKKSASKTTAAKDGGVAKASKPTFKSPLELAELWKRGLEETSPASHTPGQVLFCLSYFDIDLSNL